MISTTFQASLMPEIVEEKSMDMGGNGDMCPAVPETKDLCDPYIPQSHHHNESTSTTSTQCTTASDSTGSSPTTTVSLGDVSSSTDLSPGLSSETPMTKPLAPRPHTADDASTIQHQPTAFFEINTRSTASGKRARNLKNLAVNTSGNPGGPRGASTSLPVNTIRQSQDTVLPLRTAQAGFTRPPSPPKRRPSNLSLSIVTSPTSPNPSANSAIPPTPSLLRPNTLRHFQSSPALPLSSASNVSVDIPTLTLNSDRPVLARSFSDISSTVEDSFNFDVPQSREEKPEAYPDGPICVFEPYVDLYLEPTAEQASQYDVVLNVATEVRNPFLQYTTPDPSSNAIRLDGGGGLQHAPKRSRASSATSHTSNLQLSDGLASDEAAIEADTSSPVMTSGDKQPEYIHIPWEHNTDIVSDLPRLVKLIDDRVKQGKRTLIHCQCGVSRSATLIVAYCMYRYPGYSVQQAYDIVKSRSKWIGPNMNLIMQLQEFSSMLTGTRRAVGHIGNRSLTPIEASAAWNEWRRDASPAALRDTSVPMTAPLLAPANDGFKSSLVSLSTPAVSPGPSSAPSGTSWPSKDFHDPPLEPRQPGRGLSVPDMAAITNAPHTSGRRRPLTDRKRPSSLIYESTISPILEIPPPTIPELATPGTTSEPLASPRAEEFAMISLNPPSATSSEDTFGIMSPTSSSFSNSPLDRAALLGALGFGSSPQPTIGVRRPHPMVQVATGIFPGMQKPPLVRQPKHDAMQPDLLTDDALLSPRASTFVANPFGQRPGIERLGSAMAPMDEDPRSPAVAQAVIGRNIADAL